MPFVTMVAGPNGSGKSTLTASLDDSQVRLGEYINADEIMQSITGSWEERSREAQRRADELRASCLTRHVSFTFETVMSHVSKVEFFQQCREAGFDTVLYFVGTGDPALNVARVAQRVALGGHDVPRDRIASRYERCMS
jgi:predicted ABC-type ATPase